MKLDINLVFGVLVVLTGSSQARGQDSALPPALTPAALPSHAGASASPALTEDPGDEGPQWTHSPAGRDEPSSQITTVPTTEGSVLLETTTNAALQTHPSTESSAVATTPHTDAPVAVTAHPSTPPPSAAADGLSSAPAAGSTAPPLPTATATDGGGPPTRDPLSTFSSQPGLTGQETSSTTAGAPTLRPQSVSPTAQPTTTGRPLTSAPGRGPAGPTHQDVQPELNVGDEDLKGPRHRSSSPLDPLLAGLLSVFIVTTAVVFIVLFLKFRQRTNHPEFHRLQDLPMDDLMEDTPLSRYAY